MVKDDQSIQLAPPGAGLPFPELCLSRMLMFMARKLTSRKAASARFEAEGERSLARARSIEPVLAAKPVLIRRVWGIEDSSRYWSVFMVLDHLIITDSIMADIIEHLADGKAYRRQISLADVKPSPVQDVAVLERFSACVRNYLRRMAALERLRSGVRHEHPWFGPLDGHDWHCLAAFHHTIHRRQIGRIMSRLANDRG